VVVVVVEVVVVVFVVVEGKGGEGGLFWGRNYVVVLTVRLRTGQCEVRFPAGKKKYIFQNPPYRPWGHPASSSTGTGSFPGVKRPSHEVHHSYLVPRLGMR
jgi:hypothetical protein